MIETMLDTGSEYTLIWEGAVDYMGVKVDTTKEVLPLQGVTGRKLRVLGSICTTVRIGSAVLRVRMVVVPDTYLHLPILMGMDVLGSGNLTIDYKNQKVAMNQTVYPLKLEEHHQGRVKCITRTNLVEEERSSKTSSYLRLRQKEHVREYTSQFLKVTIDEPDNSILVVEPCHPIIPRTTISIQVVKGGSTWIPLSNSSKQAVKLHVGTLLPRYEVVKEDQLEELASKVGRITEAIGPDNDQVEEGISRDEKLQQLVRQKDWSHLTQSHQEQVEQVIMRYDRLFIVERGELGLIQQPPAHIQVSNPVPCRSPIYRYPEKAKAAIASIVQDLEERDIIERSVVAWLSPIVLVNKPTGEKRMCLDYRKVNGKLVTDIHPIPNLEELVEHVAGNQYYATLDLKDVYYQVRLDEEGRDLTTFSEGISLYRFKRLPFALSCSASIFARQLQGALAPVLKQGWVKSYLDDVIVCAPNFDCLLQRLGQVFERTEEVGIKFNL